MIDTKDPVSAMKLVICKAILSARWIHMGSPMVAAHTSGVIGFTVQWVMVRENAVQYAWASFQSIYLRSYIVWHRWQRKFLWKRQIFGLCPLRMAIYFCRVCCFFALVASGAHRKMTINECDANVRVFLESVVRVAESALSVNFSGGRFK